jgi:hypothetical protein
MTTQNSSQDERLHQRYRDRIEGELLVAGLPWQVRVRDISLGGAGVEPPIPAALGHEVLLTSPRLDFELPGRVINVAHRRTCIAFDLDPLLREKLRSFLSTTS